MGTPNAAVPSLERLIADGHDVLAVYTQPDRPSGRGNKVVFSPVKQAAIDKGIEVFQPLKIKTQEAIETFRSHSADVAVVVAYGRILPETYLKAFDLGAVNVHFSLLPKYRGAAPVNWAIVNGESETGVTTMQMDAGLDTGPILMQRETKIGREENSVELMDKLAIQGADLLSETLSKYHTLKPIEQDHGAASFAPIMKREDGEIDWRKPARAISDQIRGFQPFPTSFSFLDGVKLTFWRASETAIEANRTPGEIMEAHGGTLIIACGSDTSLSVEEVQTAGKRRMSARDLLNGLRVKPGDILGQ